ncbi:ATPase [Rhizobium sp. XQZ8]|uniref:BadF/BadG/BcrA/BcrD ATPase family protein n=1 Tax=Rhizobium populisoli TaxID=2859785 RepID=UPI001CA48F1F|nr:BadF/BadG/BcrA/BcrD ATPase family protein [Rhizobium populisoli]MBW6424345.1 ATPase [Rhizobium populisoli]
MVKNGLIAGIDVGGTKTHIIVCQGEDVVVDTVVASSEWRIWDWAADAAALAALVLDTAKAEPAAVAFGVHGCNAGWHCTQLATYISAILAGRVKVVNDSELLVPAAGFQTGVGVVSGTGSIAVARGPDDEMLVAGGWGWILGDEGSAAALVREAARAVRNAIDHGKTNDPLINGLMSKLNTTDPTKIGRLLNETRGAAVWGGYADAVFEAAAQKSSLAIAVIEDGAKALARLVGILIGRGADAGHVVIGGGVVVEQPGLYQAFEHAMAEVSPASKITLLRAAPVTGALALARRLLA